MKIMIAALLLLATANACAADGPLIQDKVDRFTGERDFKYEAPMPKDVTKPKLTGLVTIKPDVTLAMMHIAMMSWSSRRKPTAWRYLSCHTTNFLVDGQPLKTMDARHSGSVRDDGVLEFLLIPLELEQLKILGEAKTVEYRICQDEYRFTANDIAGFKGLHDALMSAKPESLSGKAVPSSGQ